MTQNPNIHTNATASPSATVTASIPTPAATPDGGGEGTLKNKSVYEAYLPVRGCVDHLQQKWRDSSGSIRFMSLSELRLALAGIAHELNTAFTTVDAEMSRLKSHILAMEQDNGGKSNPDCCQDGPGNGPVDRYYVDRENKLLHLKCDRLDDDLDSQSEAIGHDLDSFSDKLNELKSDADLEFESLRHRLTTLEFFFEKAITSGFISEAATTDRIDSLNNVIDECRLFASNAINTQADLVGRIDRRVAGIDAQVEDLAKYCHSHCVDASGACTPGAPVVPKNAATVPTVVAEPDKNNDAITPQWLKSLGLRERDHGGSIEYANDYLIVCQCWDTGSGHWKYSYLNDRLRRVWYAYDRAGIESAMKYKYVI